MVKIGGQSASHMETPGGLSATGRRLSRHFRLLEEAEADCQALLLMISSAMLRGTGS